MIGSRKTTWQLEHWYSAAPSASQTVSTMRRRTPVVQPSGQATSATGAFSDQSGKAGHLHGGFVAQSDPARLQGGERAEVLTGGGDQGRAVDDGVAEVRQDRRVGQVVLGLLVARGDAGRQV